jgi:hypothetical protein
MLVLVAAIGNQWITKRVTENTTKSDVGDAVVRGANAFTWRFRATSGLHTVWAGQLLSIGILVGLVFLFAWGVTGRSSRSFIGTFLGLWGVVLLASVLAAAAQEFLAFPDLFSAGRDPFGHGRWANALLEGPTPDTVMFGVVAGFVVALVGAIVAVATARQVVSPAPAVAAPEPQWSPDTAPPWGADYGASAAPAAMPQPGYPPPAYVPQGANPELARYATRRLPDSGEGSAAGSVAAAEHADTEQIGTSPRATMAEDDHTERLPAATEGPTGGPATAEGPGGGATAAEGHTRPLPAAQAEVHGDAEPTVQDGPEPDPSARAPVAELRDESPR